MRRSARRLPFNLGLKWEDGYGRCARACGFFLGGTTDLGLAQRIWAKTDKARVRRRARRRPFSLGLKWADGYGRCVRACGFFGGQNGLLRGEKIWHNGSGQKRTKRVRRRARRRLFSLGLTWEDGLAGVCARVGFCGVENSGAGKIFTGKTIVFAAAAQFII